ncbi:MAG: sulfurtransferase, partial [Lachnospiraceae bacterium]|nr:sulfurtransferase [Lachnospiraceae bacterium]
SGYGYIDRAGEPQGAIWGHDTDDGSYNNEDGTTVGELSTDKAPK